MLPVQCAGCRAWDQVLCPSCRSLADREPLPMSLEGRRGVVPGVVLGDYSDPLRRIVLSAKHSPRADVTDFLDRAGVRLGASLCAVLGLEPASGEGARAGRSSALSASESQVWVVPAPSSWKRRLRGRQVAMPLARAVARGLASRGREGVRVRVVDAVRLRVGATSQSGKAGPQRMVGRMGSMRALVIPRGDVRVIAVDDVVTTGATIREMERVLGGLDGVAALCHPGLTS